MVDQLLELGVAYAELGERRKQWQMAHRAEALARRLSYPEGIMIAQCALSSSDLAVEDRTQRQARVDEAQRLLSVTEGLDPPRIAQIEGCIAHMDAEGGHLDKAIVRDEAALQMLRKTGFLDDRITTTLYSRLSFYNDELGNAFAAHRYTVLQSDSLDQSGLGGAIEKLQTMNNLIADDMNFGEVLAAYTMSEDILRRLQARGAGTATRTLYHANHGGVLTALGRYPEALDILERTIEHAHADNDLYWEGRAHVFHARALLRVERVTEATRELDVVEAEYHKDPVNNTGFLWGIAVLRAEAWLASDHLDAAQLTLDNLLKELGYPGDTSSWVLRAALPVATRVALARRDSAAAVKFGHASVNAARRAARDPTQSADLGRALVLLAQAQRLGDDDTAAWRSLDAAIPALSGGLGADHIEVTQARNARAAAPLARAP